MIASCSKKSTSSESLSIDKEVESSWDEASYSSSMASFRKQKKRTKKTSRKVQFKDEVEAFHVDRDFWKFKCESEQLLCESKKAIKSLENLKATYSDKLVNGRRKTTAKRVIKT